jgi:hypothetical protein
MAEADDLTRDPGPVRLVTARSDAEIAAELKDKLTKGLQAYVDACNAVKDAGFEPVASIAPSAYGGRYVITALDIHKKF